MPHRPLLAILLLALAATAARAQGMLYITPNYYAPTRGGLMQYDTSITQEMQRNNEIDREYRASLATIPNKKPQTDPWASVRSAPRPDKHAPH